MNTTRYKILGIAMMAVGVLSSCQDSYDQPELEIPQATLERTISIADFKAEFGDELAVKVPLMDADKGIPYVLKGRVVSSDASGNIYKSIVVQDETAAIALSVNQSSMYIDYRMGQEVLINATDLWVGQYNGYIQLGMLGQYNGMPQITFMAYDVFQNHTQLNGLPDQEFKYVNYGKPQPAENPYCLIFKNFSEIPAAGAPYINVMSQLVEFPNVSFVDAGKPDESKDPDADGNYPLMTFAPYQDNADRKIRDSNGQTLIVRCSGYSSFYNDPLPEGVGTVRGILSRYGSSWQLLLRGTEDLIFDSKGRRDTPYSIAEAMAMNNNGRTGWVEGYIVGSVKPGVQEVTSAADIIFEGEALLDNNVVIAPKADCRDIEEMMIVELPYGSRIREWVNLMDNPGVLGKKLYVDGSFNAWMGMPGVTEVGAGYPSFSVEDGPEIPGVTGQGTGTKDDPYTVAYLKNIEGYEMTNVYIEGYVVGWINGNSYEKGARFGAYTRGDYAGNNLILGEKAEYADPLDVAEAKAGSVPVDLFDVALRDQYGLIKNPGILGKKVVVFGNVGVTADSWGISKVESIEVIGGGSESGNNR